MTGDNKLILCQAAMCEAMQSYVQKIMYLDINKNITVKQVTYNRTTKEFSIYLEGKQ